MTAAITPRPTNNGVDNFGESTVVWRWLFGEMINFIHQAVDKYNETSTGK